VLTWRLSRRLDRPRGESDSMVDVGVDNG
jgi:hypothetical protein